APERAIHVGDSYKADVIGARAVGITPVFIDRRVNEDGHSHGVLPPDAEVAVVRDLLELLDLIGVERPSASVVTPAI
ncbi:MAG: HAD hydrolase-like protein, partial [Candidatus Limnocylindrales bacterium]